jgi:hypothetical protein
MRDKVRQNSRNLLGNRDGGRARICDSGPDWRELVFRRWKGFHHGDAAAEPKLADESFKHFQAQPLAARASGKSSKRSKTNTDPRYESSVPRALHA